jgi:hypothetical protein
VFLQGTYNVVYPVSRAASSSFPICRLRRFIFATGTEDVQTEPGFSNRSDGLQTDRLPKSIQTIAITSRVLYIVPYSPLKVNRRFGGISRLHFEARNQRESRWQPYHQKRVPSLYHNSLSNNFTHLTYIFLIVEDHDTRRSVFEVLIELKLSLCSLNSAPCHEDI